MIGYLARRLAWGTAVLLAVALLTFTLLYVIPGDPARAVAGIRASAADVERIRAALGLDRPMLVQLADYLGGLATGDLGYSFFRRTPVLPLILERFPATAQLALAGIGLSVLVGVPLGVMAAIRRGRAVDRLSVGLTAVMVSLPSFWLGYILLDLLAFRPLVAWDVGIFPIGGYEPLSPRHLALPALTLAFAGAAYYTRLARTAMLEQLNADYVRTARSKGLAERRVLWGHAFRNAATPLITQLGLDLGFFLGGVVVIEQVFSWPGVGRLAVESIGRGDVPLIMGTVLFATAFIVVANLLADVAVALLDPRVRMV